MYPSIAVAVADVEIAVPALGDIRYAVEGLPGVQHRTLIHLVAGVGRQTRLADHQLLLTVGIGHADGVVGVVGEIDRVVAVDENAVWAGEGALAPGVQKFTV